MAELTSTGLSIDTLDEIKAEIEAEQRALISPELNQSSASVLGQLNGVFARQARKLQELVQAVYRAFDPDQATGDALDAVAALTGSLRQAATKSTVAATVNVDDGFSAAAGEMIAHVDGDATSRFVNRDAVSNTSGVAANVAVIFEAEETGPTRANAGTLTEIAGPLSGWNTITNADDAVLGEDVETDAAFRLRRQQELGGSGSGIDAIGKALVALEGMQSVNVIENTEDVPANDLPEGHCFEAIVYDGTDGAVPVVTDEQIAEAIWAKKPAGIQTIGDEVADATDYFGVLQPVRFTRAEEVEIYVEFDLFYDEDYVGDAAFKQAIVDWAAENLTVGDDVRPAQLICAALDVEGVIDVTELRLGFATEPAGTTKLTITSRQIAVFDVARIEATLDFGGGGEG